MAELTYKKRKKLKNKTFGLPGERKYPMPDKSHASNAKARSTQTVKKGKVSSSEKERTDRKADKILGKSASKSRGTEKSGVKRKSTSKRRKI